METASGSLHPSIAHAVDGLHGVEARIERLELAAQALDMRGDGVVVEHDVGRVHELLAILDVAGMTRERVQYPELGQGKQHDLAVPLRLHPLGIESQRSTVQYLISFVWPAHCLHAPEQSVHPRD